MPLALHRLHLPWDSPVGIEEAPSPLLKPAPSYPVPPSSASPNASPEAAPFPFMSDLVPLPRAYPLLSLSLS